MIGGTARPINFSEGMVRKYRLSSDEGSSQLTRKTWPEAIEGQRHVGAARQSRRCR